MPNSRIFNSDLPCVYIYLFVFSVVLLNFILFFTKLTEIGTLLIIRLSKKNIPIQKCHVTTSLTYGMMLLGQIKTKY